MTTVKRGAAGGVRRARQAKSAGFSLVEILIVCGILASLLALLFPVFQLARERARRTVCVSNLRQIGIATGLYRADYDDYFPYSVSNEVRWNPENTFDPDLAEWKKMQTAPELLGVYGAQTPVWVCPSDVRPVSAFQPDGTRHIAPSYFAAYGSSYAFADGLGFMGRREGDVMAPSGAYLASDFSQSYHTYPNAPFYDWQGNSLFIDGHVKYVFASPK